jgi:protein-S-isoprenylcysteine O-methyltransferase Ste14
VLMAAILFIGFWAPWIQFWGLGSRISLLEWLALELSRGGVFPFSFATPFVIVTGACIAAAGVVMRVWGAAWLGPGVVIHLHMQSVQLIADGPYRHVRNPLYLGLYCMVAAMSLVMPASGAVFTLIAVALLVFALIQGEESFLGAKIGQPYLSYRRSVPRLFPRLRTPVKPSGKQPNWPRALLSEINPIGVFITIAFLSWTYDHDLMIRAIIVTFGLSLVVRALQPKLAVNGPGPQPIQ